jgi:hypothetical protein
MHKECVLPTEPARGHGSRLRAEVACCGATWAIARIPVWGVEAMKDAICAGIAAGTLWHILSGGMDPVVAAWGAGCDAYPRN